MVQDLLLVKDSERPDMDCPSPVVWILLYVNIMAVTAREPTSPQEVVDALLKGYSKSEPPLQGNPTEVKLGVHINSLYAINEHSMMDTRRTRLNVDIDSNTNLPEFTLKDQVLYDCTENYTAGAVSCLEIRFILQREVSFYVLQIYIPTLLVVVVSWISFWIDIEASVAGVLIGLLTVLTMTTQSTGANATLPKVSYIKAIDIWLLVCLIFVLAALLEFVAVGLFSSKPGKDKDRTEPGSTKGSDPENKKKAKKIDKLSRIVFPAVFLVFNIIYWIIYTV